MTALTILAYFSLALAGGVFVGLLTYAMLSMQADRQRAELPPIPERIPTGVWRTI